VQGFIRRTYTDEELIEGFLAGDPAARAELPRRFGDQLLAMVRVLDRSLARRGLDEDVVQHVYLLLLTRPLDHFDRTRCDGVGGYLKSMVRLAVRDIRVQHAPPGARTREWASESDREEAMSQAVVRHGEPLVDDAAAELAEDVALARVVSKTIIDHVSSSAPAWLPGLLGLIVEGLTITEAAVAVGQSRFAVRRALCRWVKPTATLATT
jgi:hypothetical protein